MLRALIVSVVVCASASAAVAAEREPSDEERLEASLNEPPGPIPDGIAFQADTSKLPPFRDEYDEYHHLASFGWGWPIGYGSVGGLNWRTGPTPPVRSNALTHPQGMPGGSRPGLLP